MSVRTVRPPAPKYPQRFIIAAEDDFVETNLQLMNQLADDILTVLQESHQFNGLSLVKHDDQISLISSYVKGEPLVRMYRGYKYDVGNDTTIWRHPTRISRREIIPILLGTDRRFPLGERITKPYFIFPIWSFAEAS